MEDALLEELVCEYDEEAMRAKKQREEELLDEELRMLDVELVEE